MAERSSKQIARDLAISISNNSNAGIICSRLENMIYCTAMSNDRAIDIVGNIYYNSCSASETKLKMGVMMGMKMGIQRGISSVVKSLIISFLLSSFLRLLILLSKLLKKKAGGTENNATDFDLRLSNSNGNDNGGSSTEGRRGIMAMLCAIFKPSPSSISFSLFLCVLTGSFNLIYHTLNGIRNKRDGVNAAIAGLVAGSAMLLDRSKSRKRELSLYLFSRVLALMWNYLDSKHLLPIYFFPKPIIKLIHSHGATMVFMFLCSFIMYSFLYEPDLLRSSYYEWIDRFARDDKARMDKIVNYLRAKYNVRVAYGAYQPKRTGRAKNMPMED